MPRQPWPKMHIHRDVNQVRSHLNTCASSAGSENSTNTRGMTRSVSGTRDTLRRHYACTHEVGFVRLGVLDIGSNTGHLLVVDATGGAAPLPAFSHKEPLRLAEHLDESGRVDDGGVKALTKFVASAVEVAEDKGCEA